MGNIFQRSSDPVIQQSSSVNQSQDMEQLDDDIWIRPLEPWKKWQNVNKLGAHKLDSGISGYADICQEERLTSQPSPEFHAFLLDLEKRICEDSQQNDLNNRIANDVTTMIKNTFRRLEKIFPEMFVDAVVHSVGSVGDKTKVGLHDEFDFMVELPSLTKEMIEKARPVEKKQRNSIVMEEEFLMLLDSEVENEVIEIPFKSPSREGVIIKELLASLLPEWKVNTSLRRGFRQQSFVMQTSLVLHPDPGSPPAEVFCDISFCIPFIWTPDMRCIYQRSGTNADMVSENQKYHLVVNGKSCYRTNVFRENEKLMNSCVSKQARRVYRLAKILTRDFLPPVYDVKRDKLGGPIPSYWLKQIVLYMIDELPLPESWQEEQLGLRVTQLISKLHQCSNAPMSLFNYFEPKLNHLDEHPKSKRVEGQLAFEYVPAFADLLKKAYKGDGCSMASLKTLYEITTEFQLSVVPEAKLMRLNSMLNHYSEVLKRKPYTAPDFVVDIDKQDSLLDTLLVYSQQHLKGTIQLKKDDSGLKIIYKGEELSLVDYTTKYIDDKVMFGRFFFGFFSVEWTSLYDAKLQERMPDYVSQIRREGSM